MRLTAAVMCLACMLAGAAGAGSGRQMAPASGGSLILYWSDSPWPSMWSVRPDGSNRRRVYRTRQNAKRPALSPDRKWVAFDGAPPGKPPLSDFDIQLVRLNGTGRRTLVASPQVEVDAQWSPDGSLVSFTRSPSASDWRDAFIWTVRPDGSTLQQLTSGQFARWSADGQRLVVGASSDGSEGDLFVIGADGSGRRQLTATQVFEAPAAWSPDGTKILFTRYATSLLGADVFVMNADGSSVRRLTNARGDDIAAAWSPNGKRILFTSERTGTSHLFLMAGDGSNERTISRSRTSEFGPSWR